jgi:hypothetical protein
MQLENMDPSGNNELTDQELDRLLREEWKSPSAPARLRGRVFPSWWRKFWGISIRIPLPVACCLTILLTVVAWRWPAHTADIPKFQPVLELRPRIVKAQNAE